MGFRAFALIVTLALGLLAPPLPAEAQQVGKVHRIGYLSGASPASAMPIFEAFRQGMRGLGYVEGQNLAIEFRWAEGKYERLPNFAAELVHLKVDVIVTVGTPATQAAKNATGTIPIVVAAIGDPVRAGIVASLARPGGNVTGLVLLTPEMVGKQLELLTEAVPGLARVAFLWNPRPSSLRYLRNAEVTAQRLGLQLQSVGVRGPDEFDGAFAAMTRERAEALLVLPQTIFFIHRTRILDLAAKSHLPAMYGLHVQAKAGGLMAYAANLADLFRRAATYVDKILKGAKPADLPFEQPTKFDLLINLKTANTLGLTIPDSLLFQADRAIR